MPKHAALVSSDNVVVNVIVIPDEGLPDGWDCPEGCEVVELSEPLTVAKGDRREGETFVRDEREPSTPSPDVNGFLDSLDDVLSRDVTRTLLRDYPDITHALQRERWSRGWEGFADAVDAGVLSDEQAQTVSDLADEYHIPREDEDDDGE